MQEHKFKVATVKVYGDRTIVHYFADTIGTTDAPTTDAIKRASFELQPDLAKVPDEPAEIDGKTHAEVRVVVNLDGEVVHVFCPGEIMLADDYPRMAWPELFVHAVNISQQDWVSAKRSRIVADSHEAGAT